jgi:uncharacterized SAM-binding protein YcdF (DUF218 family)
MLVVPLSLIPEHADHKLYCSNRSTLHMENDKTGISCLRSNRRTISFPPDIHMSRALRMAEVMGPIANTKLAEHQ